MSDYRIQNPIDIFVKKDRARKKLIWWKSKNIGLVLDLVRPNPTSL